MIQRIQNSVFIKPVVFILVIATLNLSFSIPDEKVVLKAGTPVELELVDMIDTKTIAPGQTIDFRVKYDIKVDDKVVIAAGSIAKGQVIRSKKAKAIGSPGEVQIEIKTVSAVDGTRISLSGGNIYRVGEDQQTLSLVLGIFLCILCLLIKGKEVQIMPGTSFDVTVATSTEIEVD